MTSAPQENPGPGGSLAPAAWRAWVDHVLPFAAWIVIMFVPIAAGTRYAVQTAAGLALLLVCRPWRYYPRPNPAAIVPALAVGLLVFGIWVLPEASCLRRFPGVAEFYRLYAIRPFGPKPDSISASPYAPAAAGWTLTLIKLGGSAFVIAVIEEFFWRGFLLRWMADRNFLPYPVERISPALFLVVAACFGSEHNRWLVGILAGLLFGALYVKTRDIWAATLAHVVTNLALGIYVLRTGAYGFW